jgi:hypothetical protein
MENQMSNVKPISGTDIKAIKEEALKEITTERNKKAKDALMRKLREQAAAEDVLANIKRAIADLEQSIEDGSFVG